MRRLLRYLMFLALVAGCASPPTEPISLSTESSDPTRLPDSPTLEFSTAWATFESDSGVTIDYPAGWTIERDAGSAMFVPPSASRIMLHVYQLPVAERALADPNQWYEFDYGIQWSRPVSIPDADGILLIWARPEAGDPVNPPQLIAVFYSERHELDIRLSTSFDEEAIGVASEEGFAKAVSSEFGDFLHMMSSIRIGPQGSP